MLVKVIYYRPKKGTFVTETKCLQYISDFCMDIMYEAYSQIVCTIFGIAMLYKGQSIPSNVLSERKTIRVFARQ